MTFSLAACGGGGGGGGADSPAAFSGAFLLGFPSVVSTNGTTTVESSTFDFSVPSASLPGAGFGITNVPGAGDVHRFELTFSRGLDVQSIFPNFQLVGPTNSEFIKSGNNQLDAIRLVQIQGGGLPDTVFSLLIDRNGSIDGSNALVGDETPTTLRLYVEDPATPGQAGALPAGQYRINFRGPSDSNPAGLRTIDGEPFCLFVRTGECVNELDVNYTFSVGGDVQAPELAPSPTVPVAGSIGVGLDQEYVLRFNEAVDFQSLVGVGNVSTLEPFVSTVLPVNDQIAIELSMTMPPLMTVTNGANIVLTYDSNDNTRFLPPNYGFVAYMPDPFRDPTQVRIRLVDNTSAVGTDNPVASVANPAPVPFPVTTQNYGLDPDVYEGAGLTAPTNNLGNFLSLPPILPLPSSTAANTATLQVDVLGTMSGLASDTSPAAAPDGIPGLTDRDRNPLANDFQVSFGMRVGPTPSNNPVGQDLTVAISGNQLSAISAGRNDSAGNGTGTLIGQPVPVPNPLNDPETLGSPLDVVFGAALNPGNGTRTPRQGAGVDGGLILSGGDPAIPSPIGGPTPDSIVAGGGYANAPYNAPHGDRLYIIDGNQNTLKIFNSNTYQQIGTIPGVASPGGLGLDPAGTFLYVSNTDQGTLQRIDLQPASPNFHMVNGITAVGLLPTDVAVQPANEDILVINSGEDSFSRVRVTTFTERARFNAGVNPQQIMVTTRFGGQGNTNAYQAFVPNGFSNQVTLYESDSVVPQVFNSNGIDGKIWQTIPGFLNPTQGLWDGSSFGFWVANNMGNSSDQYQMTNFNLGPQPGFQGPPPFRTFSLVSTLNLPASLGRPTDISMPALNGRGIAYVSTTSGNVAVFSTAQSILLGTVQTAATDLYTSLDQ